MCLGGDHQLIRLVRISKAAFELDGLKHSSYPGPIHETLLHGLLHLCSQCRVRRLKLDGFKPSSSERLASEEIEVGTDSWERCG